MEFWILFLDVVILLAVALMLGVVFERFKQSAILGYLAAGTILGPGALNLISSRDAVSAMAELGVALLLFTIGLEFSWNRLRRMGPIALVGGTLQVVLTGCAAAAAGMALGLSSRVAIALGAMIAPSSTACVLRMLADRAELESVHGRNSLGILLLQDIAVVPLVLLVTALGSGGSGVQIFWGIGRAVVLAFVLVGGFYLVINHIMPRLLDITVATRNRELPILLATAACLGSAWLAHVMSLSPALGAFVAGFLLAESPFATQIRADVAALRTLFVTLFFVSIGMLADLAFIRSEWSSVAALVAVIVVGKCVIIWAIAAVFRNSTRHALATGICLAQVGEFAFLLAQIALSTGLIETGLFRLMVSATVATLFLTPFLVASAPPLAERAEQWLIRLGLASEGTPEPSEATRRLVDHVIVVGYGPAGRGVTEALQQAQIPAVVVELNPRTVAFARRQGIHAEVGDASREQVLEHLQASAARAVVVTVPDYRSAHQVICQVRSLAPKIIVIARARYHIYARELAEAGAHIVVDEEQQIGLHLGAEAIRHIRPGPSAAHPEFPPSI
ncbi:MAG: sodium:proton exchanger [Candidatus Abyssobacteria bacterium SURF_17]|uniref:Sodium:proton exchanger n=1 Tax=Candidatus Abyssobacteria bacterium SURF_17 TaxID=2093361 RepID=A0A419ENC8_9BACT|nr:MAG: sodium:proton exchanger [Candidatus Abyssubacteria bacterium SURF_17]